MEWVYYRYFNPETVGLDFEGMVADLEKAPEGSVVVLHGEAGRSGQARVLCRCAVLLRHSNSEQLYASLPVTNQD